jgi:AcrR family transcriptional regulator
MARKTKEDTFKTRELLIDAAERVFFEHGVSAATLEQIAQQAGMTRGAVYWHFKNKMEIFDAMHQRVKLPMDAMFEQVSKDECPIYALREFCIHTLKNLQKDERARLVFSILMLKCEEIENNPENCIKNQQKRAEVIEKLRKIFAEAQKRGFLADGVTAKMAAISLHAYLSGIFTDYLRNSESYDIRSAAPKMIDIFFRGILVTKDLKDGCNK